MPMATQYMYTLWLCCWKGVFFKIKDLPKCRLCRSTTNDDKVDIMTCLGLQCKGARSGSIRYITSDSWWRHQMKNNSALLAICAGNSPVPAEFPAQRPVTRGFDVFFDLCLNKQLSKQWWGWWFETSSRPLWRHRNADEQSHVHQRLLPTRSSHTLGNTRRPGSNGHHFVYSASGIEKLLHFVTDFSEICSQWFSLQ